MTFKDIVLEIMIQNSYNGDGVYPEKDGVLPFKECGLLSQSDIIYIIENIPLKIKEIYKRRGDLFGDDDIEDIFHFLRKLTIGYENDFDMFMKVLNLFKIMFNMKKDKDRVVDLTEERGYSSWRYVTPSSERVLILSSFNFKSFSKKQIMKIEKYILDNIDSFSVSLIYSEIRSARCNSVDRYIKKLCYELMISLPFSESFILKNYKIFVPWIILKNTNIENNQLINNCIFGDMTSYSMTQILRYTSNDNSKEFKIDVNQLSNNTLLYLLINKEGED